MFLFFPVFSWTQEPPFAFKNLILPSFSAAASIGYATSTPPSFPEKQDVSCYWNKWNIATPVKLEKVILKKHLKLEKNYFKKHLNLGIVAEGTRGRGLLVLQEVSTTQRVFGVPTFQAGCQGKTGPRKFPFSTPGKTSPAPD